MSLAVITWLTSFSSFVQSLPDFREHLSRRLPDFGHPILSPLCDFLPDPAIVLPRRLRPPPLPGRECYLSEWEAYIFMAVSVFFISIAMVIGPTPPGTGVM